MAVLSPKRVVEQRLLHATLAGQFGEIGAMPWKVPRISDWNIAGGKTNVTSMDQVKLGGRGWRGETSVLHSFRPHDDSVA
jgi:hypothetical protein